MIEGMIAHVASGGAGSVAGTEGGNNHQRWQVTLYFPPLAYCFSGIYIFSTNTFTYFT